jgi:AcrR family transcriptional regulator
VSPKRLDINARLAESTLRLLAQTSWSDLTLAAVARSAKVPLATLRAHARSKPALIGLILEHTGDRAAVRYKKDRDAASPRDRIFDAALTWIEVLGPSKAAVKSLYDGLKRDPLALIEARRALLAHAEWLLALAEADTGRVVMAKAAALSVMLARAMSVWFDDDKQLTQTMARLDQDLRRSQWLL